MPKKQAANPFAGRFRIASMEIYDPLYVDQQVEAFIRFDTRGGLGNFHFGDVQGEMDCQYSKRDGKPCVEFTWRGIENLQMCGRGWAVLQGQELAGEIYLHLGDATTFKAVRKR